jgi:phospholipid/cholesterol/gamma-HCH transport system substrate-binding protein
LLPLLQAIPPQDLANTLGSLAQGLSGRGEQLGQTIDDLTDVVSGLNTELPNIQQTLVGLADFSQTYADAAPELISALDNLRTTGNTVVERQSSLETLYGSLTSASNTTADFLQVNSENLIGLASNSREALDLLAEFSPTFGCTFSQFAEGARRGKIVLGEGDEYPGINVSASFVNPKGRYLPNQDEPRLFDDRGATCFEPAAPGEFFPQYPGGSVNDGSYQVPTRNPGPQEIPGQGPPKSAQSSIVPAVSASAQPASYEGSDFERDTLAVIYGQASGVAPETVPSWAAALGAPALRGVEVTVP